MNLASELSSVRYGVSRFSVLGSGFRAHSSVRVTGVGLSKVSATPKPQKPQAKLVESHMGIGSLFGSPK